MFEIFIRKELYSKISYLFRKSDLEVGALLECYNDGDKFVVENMFIVKQEVSSSSVDFDEDAVNMLLLECMDTKQVVAGWLHSHNTMASFWSTTDDTTINKLNAYIGKWVLSIVGNKKMELVGRIDYISQTPFGENSVRVDDVPIHTLPEISQDDMDMIDNTVSENVTKKKVVNYGYNNLYGYGSKSATARGKPRKDTDIPKQLPSGEPDYENMTDQQIADYFNCDVESYREALNQGEHAYDNEEELMNMPTRDMTDEQWAEYCELMGFHYD